MAARKKNSTYSINEKCIIECDLTYAVNKIGGRWKLQILDKLEHQTLRFSELKRGFPHITERMLTLQLQAMEQDGLVKRTVYAEVPPKVEYTLTPMALELGPILKQLSEWGGKQRRLTEQPDKPRA
ncbi:helix-turn-helix domain-containing protein [Chitinophaga sp. XS-30]|uniref:winged helix-turn-helix transcriptional regulator n=1 Tax=Chitinophaga sp. XS-30 TaxID=2604421 RepID=UPI0011DD2C83|nr:helix-turn-helix domain-containing protein [Chitinophaga sp. XS-30]QEH40748.1 helix-turn-helix transcriptional regulator [Chitinophaga sp. XS-30]